MQHDIRPLGKSHICKENTPINLAVILDELMHNLRNSIKSTFLQKHIWIKLEDSVCLLIMENLRKT